MSEREASTGATEHPEHRFGLGDVTPATVQTQSLVSIEGVIGVLYVAVLIARTVGVYARRSAVDSP